MEFVRKEVLVQLFKQETHGKVMDFDAFTSTQASDMQVNCTISSRFFKLVTISAAIHQRLAPRANVLQHATPPNFSHGFVFNELTGLSRGSKAAACCRQRRCPTALLRTRAN